MKPGLQAMPEGLARVAAGVCRSHGWRPLLPSLILLLVAGCSQPAPESAAAESNTDETAAAGATTEAATAAPSTGTTAAAPSAAPGFIFSFTSLQPEKEDPRVLEWIEDPCGMTPVAQVEAMPINDPSLLPDWVVEFDAGGRELRRWGKPYGAEILGVVGERLHFRITGIGGDDYWTDLEGRIGRPGPVEAITGPLQATDTACPSLPTFDGSDYERCHDVIDGVGKTRKLAWEGACS